MSGSRATPDPRRKALELLTRREHSRRELTRKLTDRGFDAEAASLVVQDMAERGFQDDGRFACALARSRMLAGQGPLRIRAELRQHGIGEDGVEAALAACEVDWNEHAADLLRRRFGGGEAPSRQETARRGAFLQRRGFDLDAIRHALSQCKD
ncbi:regulatory protein RecX [Xanthomonadaceae bacterium JHOS43]|nr:regulatory protein RecX [Xanthomonadaceae bacterium JHOS43]